jgi:hypothetical protein
MPVQHAKGVVDEIPLVASWSFPLLRSRRKRRTGLRLIVPNSNVLAIRAGSRPVYPRESSSDYQTACGSSRNAQVGCTELDAGRKSDFTGHFAPSRHFGQATAGNDLL